jgi:hypothetical protein
MLHLLDGPEYERRQFSHPYLKDDLRKAEGLLGKSFCKHCVYSERVVVLEASVMMPQSVFIIMFFQSVTLIYRQGDIK